MSTIPLGNPNALIMETQAKPSIDPERLKAEEKLIQVIDEFLELSDQTIKDEDIANSVYFFFSSHGVDVGTTVFSDAAASALYFFATNRKVCDDIEKLLGDNFYFLCELLQKLIEFCNNIRFSEANLARLDKSKWECGCTDHLAVEDILEEKNRYEYMLKHLKEKILRIRNHLQKFLSWQITTDRQVF